MYTLSVISFSIDHSIVMSLPSCGIVDKYSAKCDTNQAKKEVFALRVNINPNTHVNFFQIVRHDIHNANSKRSNLPTMRSNMPKSEMRKKKRDRRHLEIGFRKNG